MLTLEYIGAGFSLAVRHDNVKSFEAVERRNQGHGIPHIAASLKVKPMFVEAMSLVPGDHISICRYRVATRNGKRVMAWAGTRVYPYTYRYAKALINAYRSGTGTRRPYLSIDGRF